jgi:prepilin-type N-terminal cleavage/methylation domain-containing protein
MSMRHRPSSRPRRGFTLVEVLATMTLMGIALPVMMNGISVATHCADVAHHRNEAAALAESRLTEIVATGQWSDGTALSGDFSPDWPDYHWTASIGDWTQSGLEQIDMHVTWRGRDGDREIVLSTLVYNGVNAGTGASGSSTGGTTGAGTGGKTGTGAGAGGKTGTGGAAAGGGK